MNICMQLTAYKWLHKRLLAIFAVFLLSIGFGAQAQVVYYHNDVAGSPIAATDEAGNLLWRESYRPYGDRVLKPATSNTQWFHGKPVDPDTGMEDFGARNYDPVLGRFLSIDPVDFMPDNIHSFNRYNYGNNNPLKYTDPDGQMAKLIVTLVKVARKGGDVASTFSGVTENLGTIFNPGTSIGQKAFAAFDIALDLGTGFNTRDIKNGWKAGESALESAKGLGSRVEAVHGVLDPIAARRRTTAGLDTAEARILASGGRDLSPAQRNVLDPGEVSAKLRGAHAEVTALAHATKNGWKPRRMHVSRDICDKCKAKIEESGGQLTSSTTAVWPR